MNRAINDDVSIKGSTLIVGIKIPTIDGLYSFQQLLDGACVKSIQYYIINTLTKYSVDVQSLYQPYSDDPDNNKQYKDLYAFTVDTTNLKPGVLMVEITMEIPEHNNIPKRTEIARCSTGVAIIE